MTIIVYILLFIVIYIMILALTLFIKTKEDKEKKVDRQKEYFTKRKSLKKLMDHSLIKKIDSFIKEAGNPFGMNTVYYMIMHTSTLIIALILIFKVGLIRASVATGIISGSINLLLIMKIKERRERVKIALCDIQDIIYFQSKIGTSTDIILASAARVAKEPLKGVFQEVATKYKVTRDLEKALDILTSAFPMMEMKAFSIILKQKEVTGTSEENHKAQMTMIKRNKRLRRIVQRETKRRKLLVAALLLAGCYTLMVVVPMIADILVNVDKILR